MNLDMVRPENETEDLLFSITKNCLTIIHQTHTKPQETLGFKLTTSREVFSFKPSIILGLDSNWMIGLRSLEVINSILNITEENNIFEGYTDTFDELSFTELKVELEEIPDISKITPEHLQDKIRGPRKISAYKKLEIEKKRTDGYIKLLMGYATSLFPDFDCYLRIVGGLDDDDFQLILKQYNSNSITSSKFYQNQ